MPAHKLKSKKLSFSNDDNGIYSSIMQTGLPATETPEKGIDFVLASLCLHPPHLATKTGEHYHEIGNETCKNISLNAY